MLRHKKLALGSSLILLATSLSAAVTEINTITPGRATNIVRGFIVERVGEGKLLYVEGTNVFGVSSNAFQIPIWTNTGAYITPIGGPLIYVDFIGANDITVSNTFVLYDGFGFNMITAPTTEAVIDMSSTNKGLLIPRMTTAQRDALVTENGLLIYNTTDSKFNFWNNISWIGFNEIILTNFNITQFRTNDNIISIKDGAVATNLSVNTQFTVNGSTLIEGDFQVGVSGNANIENDLTVNGTANLTENAFVTGTLYAGGAITGNSTFSLASLASLDSLVVSNEAQITLLRVSGSSFLDTANITNSVRANLGIFTNQAFLLSKAGDVGKVFAVGTGGELVTSNFPTAEGAVINEITIQTNNFTLGNGAKLTITNYVRFPWTTLSMSGSNVSIPNLTSNTFFKLTLTNDAFIGTPTGLPGTNLAQTIQFAIEQDSTGGRTLTWTNGSWKFPGGTAPTMTSAANAVDIYTFVSSPFNTSHLVGVQTADVK